MTDFECDVHYHVMRWWSLENPEADQYNLDDWEIYELYWSNLSEGE